MIFRFPKSGCLPLIAMLMGWSFYAHAQATMHHGAAISFSSPDNDEVETNMPSLTAKPPAFSDLGTFQPAINLNPQNNEPLPLPPMRMLSPGEAAQMQRQEDLKKNWALMTPEEIMGVQTPEEIMGIPERDKNGFRKNESLTERYLERQENRNSPTNLLGDDSQMDFSESPTNSDFSAAPNASPLGIQFPQFSPRPVLPNSIFSSAAGISSSGSSLFGLGAPEPAPTTPTPEQIAANEAFQKLLEPHSSPEPAKLFPGENIFQPGPDTLTAKPVFNPLGNSFTPLSGNVGVPETFKPLPQLIPKPETAPVAPPGTPQLPPWMSSGPQTGVIPQRQF